MKCCQLNTLQKTRISIIMNVDMFTNGTDFAILRLGTYYEPKDI